MNNRLKKKINMLDWKIRKLRNLKEGEFIVITMPITVPTGLAKMYMILIKALKNSILGDRSKIIILPDTMSIDIKAKEKILELINGKRVINNEKNN